MTVTVGPSGMPFLRRRSVPRSLPGSGGRHGFLPGGDAEGGDPVRVFGAGLARWVTTVLFISAQIPRGSGGWPPVLRGTPRGGFRFAG